MTYTYRTARPSDAPQCVKILRDWAEETDWMPELDELAPMEVFWRDGFLTEMAWVAKRDDRIVGFCLRNRGDENNIGALYVASDARGSGVGKALLDMAKADCSHITVWAYELNENARRFYRREELVEVSRETDDDTGLVDIEHHWTRGDQA